ncbi:RHS repeat-associated core domain-containing protein [Leptospira bouyouniensis]|uniref:RHS repeat-associated core domain-containing protein n=1 Tax=Leptospira bouyouniensis TaxID=2484911 RepID=UPI00142E79C1|nr:RHS repeat-associated core domain-containing protein [Leptospira bouyouniensis]
MKFSKLKNILLLSFAFFSFSSFTLMDFWNEKIPQNLPIISVDQFGNAITTFPIELPVALKEIAPNLQLSYNSELPTGLLGKGWDLNLNHYIERDVRGSYDHGIERFTSTLGGELVPSNTLNIYRTKPESLFIFKKLDSKTWQAKDKNGLIYTFGGNDQYQTENSLYSQDQVQRWWLTSVKDTFGVGYTVTYEKPNSSAGIFVTKIAYQNREISFEYRDNNDNAKKYTNFIQSQDNQLISEIRVKVAGVTVRLYKFDYSTNLLGEAQLITISREESNNFGDGKYFDIQLSYSQRTQSVYGSKVEKRIPNLFAVSRVPLQDKFECNLGTLNCLAFNTMVCNMPNPASLLVCQTEKARYGLLCSQFQNTWWLPCMTGTRSPNNLLTFGDTDGDGSLEGVRLVGNEDEGSFRIVTIKNPTTSMDESTVSPNLHGIGYNSFSTMSWGDVDGDGNVDLAYSNGQNVLVTFARNGYYTEPYLISNLSLVTPPVDFLFSPPDLTWKGGLVDMDGDGRSDYIKKINDTTISISYSQGTSFSGENHIDIGPIFINEKMGQFIDFDSDGKPEFVHILNGEVVIRKIFLNSGNSIEYRMGGIYTGNGNIKEEGYNRWLADINSDGRPDFCVLLPNGLFYTYLNLGKSFAEGVNQGYLSGMVYQGEVFGDEILKTKTFADVNGDGKVDLLAFDGSRVAVNYGNGQGFVSGGTLAEADSFYGAMDLNKDGRVELIHLKADKNAFLLNVPYLSYYPAIQDYVDGTRRSQNFFAMHARGFDAFVSLFKAPKTTMSPGLLLSLLSLLALYDTPEGGNLSVTPVVLNNSHDKLVKLSDGMWFETEIRYKKTEEFQNAIQFNIGSYPKLSVPISKQQVYEIVSKSADKVIVDRYDYQNFRIHLGDLFSRAYYGFEKVIETNLLHNVRKEIIYNQAGPQFAGLEKSIMSFYSDGTLAKSLTYNYQIKNPFGVELVLRNSQVSESYIDSYLYKKEEYEAGYDIYGNALSQKTFVNNILVKEEESNFDNNTSFDNYFIGRLKRMKSYSQSELVSDEEFNYTNNNLVAEVVSFTGSPDQSKVTMTYDMLGRNTVKNIPGIGEVITEYDSDSGINVVSQMNSLGHRTEKRYDLLTDSLIEEISPNGTSLKKTYDPFLNEKSETLPGDSEPSLKQSFKFMKDETKLQVIKQSRNSEGGYSVTTEIINHDGKPESKITQLNESSNLTERMIYDSNGRLYRKYNPIISGLMEEEWEEYNYDNFDRVTSVINSNGERISISYSPNQLVTTTNMFSVTGELVQTLEIEKNVLGQEIRRTMNGSTHTMSYNPRGEVKTIIDSLGNQTRYEYDTRGRKIGQIDKSSGNIEMRYDLLGRISKTIKSDGTITEFTYDSLSRIKSQVTNGKTISYLYDVGGATSQSYPVGRLTQVNDGSLTVLMDYDMRGNVIRQKKMMDDITLFVESEYDTNNNPTLTRYPEGTVIHYTYGSGGHLNQMTLDSADGNSTNQLLVKYEGPFLENDRFVIKKIIGNGVESTIEIDKKFKRLTGLRTKLADGFLEQNLKYEYDPSGNISKILDNNREDRTQNFEYDSLSRLVKSSGKYGEELYEYSADGNLLKRGDVTFKYENLNKPHLVTEAKSPQIGTFHYSYDSNGNMVNRNGDVHTYDSNNLLTSITTVGGTSIRYYYDHSGNRIKKDVGNGKQISYNLFGDAFEITREEGIPESVTIYLKGLKGEPLAQITIPDVQYLRDENFSYLNPWDKILSLNLSIFDCSKITMDCELYRKNKFDSLVLKPLRKQITNENIRFGTFSIQFAFLGFLFIFVRNQKQSNFSIFVLPIMRYANVLLLFSFLLGVSNCGFLGIGGDGDGKPLILFPTHVSDSAKSVNDEGNDYIPGTGAIVPPISPTTSSGISFQHADHLGSVSFLSDSKGNPLSGGDWTGRSRIAYKPYGLIHRTDSGGPDISKIKYAGQTEEKESGLYYMKARYYDPFVGRFLTGDQKVYPKQIHGMNRYMYANGNPINYHDPTGYGRQSPYLGAAVVYLLSSGMNESDRLLLTASAFRTFRGNERGKQTYIEKTIGQNASHLGKPHISKALQYALAAYYLLPADNDFDRVRNLFMGFTMGKRAGGTYSDLQGKREDKIHIGKSWKWAFAAFLLVKDNPNANLYIASAYLSGKNNDHRDKNPERFGKYWDGFMNYLTLNDILSYGVAIYFFGLTEAAAAYTMAESGSVLFVPFPFAGTSIVWLPGPIGLLIGGLEWYSRHRGWYTESWGR